MLRRVEEYISVVGDDKISKLHKSVRKLYEKHIVHINSTFLGGGVAEILNRMIPLLNDIGITTGWRVLHGNPSFFDVTKKFHNGMQGRDVEIPKEERHHYVSVNQEFASYSHMDHDLVVIHDPQPLPLIHFFQKRQPWIWRCHIDISDPNPEIWDFLKIFMLRYDAIIVSCKAYKKDDLPVKQYIIHPAIDPLAAKNCEMSDAEIAEKIKHVNIPTDKPLLTQVSRMDKWKDPEGVFKIFEKVKKKVDCRLLYCYNMATDDPEGMDIYTRLYNEVKELVEEGEVLFVVGNNDELVNAIQQVSDVVIQKSTKEGFCLTVTEAMWKARPVVASRVGGIPEQIDDGVNGYLLDPLDYDGFADRIVEILKNKKLGEKLGKNAREKVREKFITTRLMQDYINLMSELMI